MKVRTTIVLQFVKDGVGVVLFLCLIVFDLSAQKVPTRISGAEYWLHQEKITVSARLMTQKREPLPNETIALYLLSQKDEMLVGKSKSDSEGHFKVSLSRFSDFVSLSQTNHFVLKYDGSPTHEAAEYKLEAKAVNLLLEITEEDGQYFVETSVSELIDSTQTPVPEIDVYLYVKRLFGLLPIGETWTDENGTDRIKLPEIPGGSDGTIEIVARLEDTDRFGNVETRLRSNQGIIIGISDDQTRALWTSKPPLWMLITFIILMGTVWTHYLIVIFNLLSIKRKSQNLDINFKSN